MITVSVTDGTSVAEVSFNLTVESVNDEPVFTSEAIVNVAQDEFYSYTVEVEDIDGDGISYSASIHNRYDRK